MTYGFFLKVLLSPGKRIMSDESDARELTLPEPIGLIRYRGSPLGNSFSESPGLLFMGLGYESYDKAENAGRRLKAVIQLASLDTGIAIDVGKDDVRGGPGQVVIDAAARDGVLLLPDVHGLKVFEETGQPVQLSGTAKARVLSPLAGFESAVKIRSTRTREFDNKHALAAQLHAVSDFETSQRSRLLTLVTALDVLSVKRLRGGISEEVARELLTLTKAKLKQARPFQDHDVSPRMVNGRSMERPAHRVASVTSMRPAMRSAPIARLRRAAMTLGPDRVLTWDLSS